MSEQALKPASSGTGSATGSAATGSFPVLTGGKTAPAAGNELPKVEVEKPDIDRLVQELNTVSRSIGRDLRFQVDLDRGIAVIQVLDSETGEIIRQIPKEDTNVVLSDNGSLQIRLFDEVV